MLLGYALKFAVWHCISTGNATGAYVYSRILWRHALNEAPDYASDRY